MRDIGYMAQRSSNPKAVLDFLNALPPGTLESGIDDIPLDEVRKQFKLRSPKMTKALVRLGVHPDVVAGYYAGFSNQEAECRVYHMTTFPHPEVMKQQSISEHFSSCMNSGALGGEKGGYYYEYIDYDIAAYEAGDLGMLVVGKHAVTIGTSTGKIVGDGVGFRMRAKIRLLYRFDTDELFCILVDRVYGQKPLLRNALKSMLEWSSFAYPGSPIIMASSYFRNCNWNEADSFRTKHDLYYPHNGYQDTLEECFGKNIAKFAAERGSTSFVVISEDLLSRANQASSQLKVYKASRQSKPLNTAISEEVPGKLYINRSTDTVSNLYSKELLATTMKHCRGRYTVKHCKRLGVFNTRLVNLLKILQFEQRSKPLFEDGSSVSGRVSLGGGWNLSLCYGENRYSDYRHIDVTLCNENAYVRYISAMDGNYNNYNDASTVGTLDVTHEYLENHSRSHDSMLLPAIRSVIKLIITVIYLEPIDKTKQRSYNSGVAYLRRMHEQIQQLRDCTEKLKELQ